MPLLERAFELGMRVDLGKDLDEHHGEHQSSHEDERTQASRYAEPSTIAEFRGKEEREPEGGVHRKAYCCVPPLHQQPSTGRGRGQSELA